jgi:hypothetical protein
MRRLSRLPLPATASRIYGAPGPGRSRARPPGAAPVPGRASALQRLAASTSSGRSGGTRMAVRASSFPRGCGA